MILGLHLPLDSHLRGEAGEALARVLDSITDGLLVVDEEWRITYANEAARNLYATHFGASGAVVGRDHWEVFPELRGTFLEQEYHRAMNGGVPVELENYYLPWDAWFSIRAFPVRGGGLSIYFRNVTEAKRADGALRASEEKYRFLFNAIDEGFAVVRVLWSPDGSPRDCRFEEANPMFEKLTGISAATGCTLLEKVPGIEVRWCQLCGRVARTRASSRLVEHSAALDRWLDVYAFPLERQGNLVALLLRPHPPQPPT